VARKYLLAGVSCAAVAVAVSLHSWWVPLLAQVSPKAHWEPYKLQHPTPSVDQHLTDPALTGAIDLHAHYGPDSYDRQWDAFEVVKLAKERGMRAVVLKNHWSESAGLAQLIRKYGTQGIEVFGAVTLDTPVGGVNPMAVRYMSDVEGKWGRIVWMPTHDSEHEVNYNKETRAKAIVSRNGKLIPEVFEVLDLIKERNLTLATGHVEPEEALEIMAEAKKRGITKIIVTHPLLGPQFTYMSLPQLQESVKLGGAVEITAGTLFRDGAAKTRAIEFIKALGTQNVFVASDSGLVGTPNHPDALAMAAKSLRAAGFTEQDLKRMFKDTPARLIGLPVQ
jgi:FMN phosphatase YigB (HAD superfamily)